LRQIDSDAPAREMAGNSLLDSGAASAIQRTKGVKQQGVRAGNWLLKEQANELLNALNPVTLKGKRRTTHIHPGGYFSCYPS
jgi:hypothetical protein